MVRLSRVLIAALAALAACSNDGPVAIPPTGTPTQLSMATQPSATAQSGAALATPPVVRLKDSGGSASATAGVLITATTGAGATLTSASATTDGSGTARFAGLTLTGLVGPYTLHFTSGSLTAVDAQPVALAAGAPAALSVTVQPSTSAAAGVALAQQPTVQLRDASGNAVARAGVVVSAAVASGTAAITHGTATTNASGTAVFSGLVVAGASGPYTLRFNASGCGSADAAAATTLSAGTATQVALLTQPSTSSPSGTALPTQPVLQLEDAFGNHVAQAGVKVAATLLSGPGGSTVANDTAVSDATGKATFSGYKISGLVGSYTLRFTAPGLASAVASSALALIAGPPASLVIATQPSGIEVNNVPLVVQPAVIVSDSQGNRVAQAGIVVTASVNSGNPAIINSTATSDATGKATFSGLKLVGAAPVQYTFLFNATVNATPLPQVQAAGATQLNPGAPTHLAVRTQPSANATNAAAIVAQPAVELRDTSDNFTPQTGFTVTAALTGANSGNAVVSNGSVSTNAPAQGVATFTNLTLTGLAALASGTPYTLRFGATNLGFVDANVLNLFPGNATRLALTIQPSTAATSGAALAQQPVVQLQDVSGNATATPANVQITTGVLSGSVTIANGTVFTAAGTGAATFTNLTLTASPGSFTLIFSATGLTAIQAAQPTVVN
ncbi:MAG: beta strand repeat-containing protein [Gemmatimonadales bacterium]